MPLVDALSDHHPGARLEFVLAGLAPEVLRRQSVQLRVADGVQNRDGIGDRVRVDGRAARFNAVARVVEQAPGVLDCR